MSPDTSSGTELTSYKFEDCNEYVNVKLYANGAIESKDLDVSPESDSLEVNTPTNEKWVFRLYDHVYPDRTEIETETNTNKTQTTIKLRLYKQRHTTWPQLNNRQHTPITPQQKDQNIEMIDQQEPPYELSFKTIKHEFTETKDNKAIVHIMIKQVFDCQVHFTDTNFTAIFHSNDEDFLQNHSITSKTPIKLLVRVRERIKPNLCTQFIAPDYIYITLVKDYSDGPPWTCLAPYEYSESRPLMSTSPLSTYPLSITNTNRAAIPLPASSSIDRQSDSHTTGSTFYLKGLSQTSNTTVIGYTGIYNPANSCFMNAALQCLSNTRELRDYFLQSRYIVELNQTNPLGMKGVMAEEFANVIKNLWSGQTSFTYANLLRDYAAKRHTEFVGNGQHDAQELLTILLDAIHEDLNRVIIKPQVPPIEDENRPDEVIADEYWRGYLTRNDSVIVQLFTGQFKSKTKCPQCDKESVTFDPFTSLSVPIPKRIAIDTIVIYGTDEKPPIKFRISMSGDGSIGDLKRLLSHKSGLSITKMLAYKIPNNRTIEYLKDEDNIPSNTYGWHNSDLIYITEVLTSAECDNEKIVHLTFYQRIFKLTDYVSACAYCQAYPSPNSSPKFCQKCYRVSYCDQHCQKLHANDHKFVCGFRSSDNYEIIGLPFVVSLPESKLTCANVFEQIKIHAKRSVDIDIERARQTRRSITLGHQLDDYGAFIEDEEEDSFSDIENSDWATIKSTLSSADCWSICRIGDYFVKTNRTKRHHQQQQQQKDQGDKLDHPENSNEEELMVTGGDSSSESGTEDFDMLDDIYGSQPLFRIMPQSSDSYSRQSSDAEQYQPIIEHGDDADRILRDHTTFSIDWFTDNKNEAPLRVTSSKHRNGLNNLIEDESVNNSSSGDQDVTLQQCLQLFIEPEVLGPDDKWYCPHCKEHIQAEKRMSVWRLPPILIIHLKRFKYNQYSAFGYMSNSREKIETTIKFPIHDLNMAPYCSSISGGNQGLDDVPQARYDLYGIINHRGTAWFGHYTSYARLLANNDAAKTEIGWRTFDDDRVSSLPNVKDVVRSDAYVLFYRHRHLSVNISIEDRLQRILTESTQ